MRPNHFCRVIIASFMSFGILACSGTFAAAFPTQTGPAPTETVAAPPPPATPTPPVTLSSVSLHEENQNPTYEIKAQVPALDGNPDPRVINFNTAMMNFVNMEINKFRKDVSELAPAAYSVSPGSFLDVTYALTLQRSDLWSFKFNFSGYFAGAAHPYLYSLTVNYDLGQGRELTLSDLFLPNSNYLEAISNHCTAELNKRDIGFATFPHGAEPASENYLNWNITTDGLMITFDEGMVAAYAAGPQTVVVPYSELQAITNPAGPLAGINP
ncbi:MAG TPA: RsiV family protein [Anaerolineales bacterium]|nr:RsiV family protein [Anaerolineales bacterium]